VLQNNAAFGLTVHGEATASGVTVQGNPTGVLVQRGGRLNVAVGGMDRLTLTAVHGASVSDASSGTLTVIDIEEFRDVAINGFTINAGSDGVSGANGIVCGDFSACRLSGNVIQGAACATTSQLGLRAPRECLQRKGAIL
jgi:hypothetical protein